MPSQLCHRTVCHSVNPSFIDSMGKAIYINSRGRGFQIRIVTIQQLMPETFTTLAGSKTTYMSTEQLQYFIALRIILRQHIQDLTHSQQRPTIGTSPMESRMILHTFHPSMTEKVFPGYPHTVCKLKYLTYSFAQIHLLFITGNT